MAQPPPPLPPAPLPLFGGTAPSDGREPTVPLDHAAAAANANTPLRGLPPAPAGFGRITIAAWPLLGLLARLRTGAAARNVDALKAACIRQLRQFDQDAAVSGAAPGTIRDARYALCTALDETVLGTPWGDSSDWAQDSLLATFHGETWGGEKVFALVDRVLADPRGEAELAELLYLLLSFGFQGQYHLRRNGGMEVEALRERLGAGMGRALGAPPDLPVPRPRGGRRRRLVTFIPIWVAILVTTLAAALVFVGFEEALLARSRSLVPKFNAVLSGTLLPGGT